MKLQLFRPLLVLAVALFSGCMGPINSSSGTPLDSAKIAQIVKGKTTRAEVEVLLGKPEQTMLIADGRRMMSYNYSAMDSKVKGLAPWNIKANITTRTQTLQIYLTKDAVVEDYEFNDNTKDIQGDGMGRTHSTTR